MISADCICEQWEQDLRDMLPLFGHRNWIVVADSAYPAQASNGIKTIATSAEHGKVLNKTLEIISDSKHVCARVYLDAELKYVIEQDAPGVSALRNELNAVLKDRAISELEHERIIEKLDESSQMYQVLVLKTSLTIPYATVFIQLDCEYWNGAAEARLRRAMAKARPAE